MNTLIEQCRRLGIRLWVEGGALAYDAPKGPMTSELAAALKATSPTSWQRSRITGTYARNKGYLWASLQAALASYPDLLALLPDKPGPIDSLTLGTATVYVREGAKPGPRSGSIVITEAELDAARKGRTVVGRERSPRRRR